MIIRAVESEEAEVDEVESIFGRAMMDGGDVDPGELFRFLAEERCGGTGRPAMLGQRRSQRRRFRCRSAARLAAAGRHGRCRGGGPGGTEVWRRK